MTKLEGAVLSAKKLAELAKADYAQTGYDLQRLASKTWWNARDCNQVIRALKETPDVKVLQGLAMDRRVEARRVLKEYLALTDVMRETIEARVVLAKQILSDLEDF